MFKQAVSKGSETSWQSWKSCFIFFLLSANRSVSVQISVICISLPEMASIYFLAELDTLWPSKGAQLGLNLLVLGQRRSGSSGQSLIHFHFVLWVIKYVYLAIFLCIYRLFLFSLQREVEKIIAVAWNIFQPFLFGLIGVEVSVMSLRPETVGKIIH